MVRAVAKIDIYDEKEDPEAWKLRWGTGEIEEVLVGLLEVEVRLWAI